MKAAFENNTERGRGYARLRLSEVAHPSSGGWRFSLCRGSDMTYLGRSGWQNSEDFTEPETYSADGDDLILHIGPDVVNRLDPNENYRITLQGDGQPPQAATFAITTLNRSLMDTRGHISAETAKQPVAPAPPPSPAPELEPAPDDAATPLPPPVPEAPKKNRLPVIFAVLLVLALLAGGAYWFINNKNGGTGGPSTTENGTTPVTPIDPPLPSPSTHQQVTDYLNNTPTPQGAVELADKLTKTSAKDQDAVFRLWYYAVGKGDAAACLHLGRVVDPSLPPWGSILKNGAEAWSLYEKARQQQPDAANAMHALKQWLEKEAQQGNRDAEGWIRKIAEDSARK